MTWIKVVIPTHNRASLLRESLTTVLDQQLPPGVELTVEIHDNASTDATAEVLAAIDDRRVRTLRHEENVGLFRNWKQALEPTEAEYLAVLQDDDLWHATYLARMIEALEEFPSAGFACCDVDEIDGDGVLVVRRPGRLAPGLVRGHDYLHRVVDGEDIAVDMSSMVMRTAAFRRAGGLVARHQLHDIVFNLQYRIAERHDVVRVPEVLASVRFHPGQAHRTVHATGGAIGMVADRMDAAAMLLRSDRAGADQEERRWLAERLIALGTLRSQYTADDLPGLLGGWAERAAVLTDALVRALPETAVIAWTTDELVVTPPGRAWSHRFVVEVDGSCGGSPTDAADAVHALEARIAEGVEYLVVPWPTFWWLDSYGDLRRWLGRFSQVADDSTVVVFELRDR